MEQLIKDVEKCCLEKDIYPGFNVLFKKFIIMNPQLQQAWIALNNSQLYFCLRQITDGEISFRCFTCNPNHLYCEVCFKIEFHQDHQCVLQRNATGYCDCGFDQKCKLHTCSPNQSDELQKIPQILQEQITNLIKAICINYFKYMTILKQEYHQHDTLIVQIYYYSDLRNHHWMKNAILANCQMDNYFKSFIQALIIHQALCDLLLWLISSKYPLLFLITKILSEKLFQESNQSLLEDIFENQVILDTQGPYLLDNDIFQRLFYDQNFKLFAQAVYLKQYKKFWLIIQGIATKEWLECLPYLSKIRKIKDQVIITQQEQIEMAKKVAVVIKQIQELPNTTILIFLNRYHKLHLKFNEDIFQKSFYNDQNLKNVFNFQTQIWNKVHNYKIALPDELQQMFEIFYLRLEVQYKESIIIDQLMKCFGNDWIAFKELHMNKLDQFPFEQFFFTTYIKSLGDVKSIQLNLDNDGLMNLYDPLKTTSAYLKILGRQINIIQQGFYSILQSLQKISPFSCLNFCNLLLFQCYKIIRDKRNIDIDVNKELDQAFERLVLGYPENQYYERLSKIYFLLIKSQTIVDKVFIFLLCYIFNEVRFDSADKFKRFLLELLEKDEKTMKMQFHYILSRCIQTLVSVYFCLDQDLKNLYFKQQKKKKLSILESFDLSFIKLYIFIFGSNGFLDFEKLLKQKHLPQFNRKFLSDQTFKNILELKLLGSDICMYNVCGNMFVKLPKSLKLSLLKYLQNIFAIQSQLTFELLENELDFFQVQLHYNTKTHILQLCELVPQCSELRLRKEFAAGKIFDCNDQINCPALFLSNNYNDQSVSLVHPQQINFCIERDLEQFDKGEFMVILFDHLQFFIQDAQIIENLKIMMNEGFSQNLCQLLNIQIVALHYLNKNKFEKISINIINNLKNLARKLQNKDDQQIVKQLLVKVQKLMQKQVNEIYLNPELKTQSYLLQLQLKKQYQIKQTKALLKHNFQQQQSQNTCSLCKGPLESEEWCSLIFISTKSLYLNEQFSFLQECYLKFDSGLSNCNHFYHNSCLKYHEINTVKDQGLPFWMNTSCPICQQLYNVKFPLTKIHQIEDFQQSMLVMLRVWALRDEFFEDESLFSKMLILFLLLQIFDLVCQLFIYPEDFKNSEKQKIFAQMINLLLLAAQKQQNQDQIYFQASENKIMQFMQIVEKCLVTEKDMTTFKQVALQWIMQLGLDSAETINLLHDSFSLSDVQNQLRVSNQVDKNILILKDIPTKIQEKIIQNIGTNFQEFYKKFFLMCCSNCGFYISNQNQKLQRFICLFCPKIFCFYRCTLQEKGPLTKHADEYHKGHSFYVNIENGSVMLLSIGVAYLNYCNLFYNQLGQQINIQDETCQWKEYILNVLQVKNITKVVIENQFQTVLYRIQKDNDQFKYMINL